MKKKLYLSMLVLVATALSVVSCDSSDPAPPAAPTITVTAPADSVEYITGNAIYLSASLTSGSNLSNLTASVIYKSDLKALAEPWNPTPVVVTLNGTPSQTLTDQILFSTIPSSAKAGIYHLKLVVTDSGNQSVTKEIPFLIIN